MQGEGSYYVIGHLTRMTGLSDRTIRSYLASGLLQGEKINGVWHFTPQQVEEFIRHPAVRPSIRAKSNAIVYDFLLSNCKAEAELCVILDAPRADRKALAEFFSYRISGEDYRNIEFSFDGVGKEPRVIIRGRAPDVLALMNRYSAEHPL